MASTAARGASRGILTELVLDARISIGFLLAIWAAAHVGDLLGSVRPSPFRLPVAIVLLGSAMEFLAPLFAPVSTHSTYPVVWRLVKLAGVCWLGACVFRGVRRRGLTPLDTGPLWERSRELAVLCGSSAQLYVSDVPARNPREVLVRPIEIRSLSCGEVDGLLARQFCFRGVDWGHELALLSISFASAAFALALYRQLLSPEAGRFLLLVLSAATAGVAAWLAPDPSLHWIRRAILATRDPESMFSALHAQAELNGVSLAPAEIRALARALNLPGDRVSTLVALPLPRPAGERYPWSTGDLQR